MNKGVVIESGKKWTIVLTRDGQFVKIPSHPQHLEGKEVAFLVSPAESSAGRKRWRPPVIKGISLAAACFLLFMVAFPFFGSNPAYAAVTIDINPSVELEVDREAQVISADALNADGEKILQSISWKEQPLAQVTLLVIEAAEKNGLMNTEKRVLITTTFYNQDTTTEDSAALTHIVEDVSQKADETITVVLVEGKKDWHEEAKDKNVSPGAYMLVKKAEEQGIALQEADVEKGDLERLLPVKGVKVIHPQGKDQEADKKPIKPKDQVEPASSKLKPKSEQLPQREDKRDQSRPAAADKNSSSHDREKGEKEQQEKAKKEVEKDDKEEKDKNDKEKGEREDSKAKNERVEDKQSELRQPDQDNREESVKNRGPQGPDSHARENKDKKVKDEKKAGPDEEDKRGLEENLGDSKGYKQKEDANGDKRDKD